MKTVTELRRELLSIRAAVQDEWGYSLTEMKADPDISREEINHLNLARARRLSKIDAKLATLV